VRARVRAHNVAHRTLAQPASRAQYLLRLAGRDDPIAEARGSRGVSAELLAEVMEAREVIADAAAPRAALEALRARNRAALGAIETDLAAAFAAGDLGLAGDITVALQYSAKIDDEVGERLDGEDERARASSAASAAAAAGAAGEAP
jgi:DnaJ-domain-containing protein 1